MSQENSPADSHHPEVAEQHAVIGVRKKVETAFQRNPHPDAQWFGDAALGLFIHWGISAVRGEGDLSWSMMAQPLGNVKNAHDHYGMYAVQAPVTPAFYWEQAKYLDATRYNPNQWLKAAREAGFEYAALTTRHHDGFAFWPSAFGDFNTKNYLGGRDLVGEYVDACRANGLKVGLYYSPPDWHWNRHHRSFRYSDEKPALGLHHEPIELPVLTPEQEEKRQADFRAYLKGQIEELLTRYGKIDLLWFDGDGHNAISVDRIRELQPGIVINQRAHGYGDYIDSECVFPKKRHDGWWDYCHVWADGGWAYLNHETYKPMGWFLGELARARSWGGNFLPSIGPDGHGDVPEVVYKRFAQLKSWMQHSGQSIHNVRPGPWPECSNVPVTCQDTVWYAFLDWVHEGAAVIQKVDRPKSVKLLRDGTPLTWKWEASTLSIDVPKDLRTTLVDVVAIEWTSRQNEAV